MRDDGGAWSKVDIPAAPNSSVIDVTATTNGFLMVEQVPSLPRNHVQLWSSADGRAWTALSGAVPNFDTVSIAGDRIIGVDSGSTSIYVSNDAGATWIATQNVGGLLPSGTALEVNNTIAAVGPLGYAALVRSGGGGRTEHATCCTAATVQRGRSPISVPRVRRRTARSRV